VFVYRIPLLQTDPHFFELGRDLEVPIYLSNLIGNYYPIWNPTLAVSNIANAFHIDIMFILVIARALNLPPMTAVEIIMAVGTTFTGFFGYITIFYLLSKTYGFSKYVLLASLFGGIFLIFNPHWAADPRHYGRKIADAYAPLVFLFFWIGFKEKRIRYIFAGAFAMTLYSADAHNLIAGAGLAVFIAAFVFICEVAPKWLGWKRTLKSLFTNVTYLVSAATFYVLLAGFGLFPLLARTLSTGFPSPYPVTYESALQGVLRANLINAMRFDLYPVLTPFLSPPPFLQGITVQSIIFVLPLLVFVSALSVAFVGPRNRETFVVLCNLILWTCLSTGVNFQGFPYVADFYRWLLLSAPFHTYFFWAFREPIMLWTLTLPFAAILLGYLSFELVRQIGNVKLPRIRRIAAVSVLVIIAASVLLPAWPMFTGDFGGNLKPLRVPQAYFDVNAWLRDQPGDFKVLWFPIYTAQTARWGELNWTRTQTDPELWYIMGLQSFDMMSSSQGTYGVSVIEPSSNLEPIQSYIMSILSTNYGYPFDVIQGNRTSRLGQLLAPLNIRYIVVNTDIQPDTATKVLQTLASQDDLRFVRKQGFFFIYENLEWSQPVYSASQTILVEGGREVFPSLGSLTFFNSTRSSLLFLDEMPEWDMRIFDYSQTMILHDWRNLLPFVDLTDVYPLTPYTIHGSTYYHSSWAKGSSSEQPYEQWTPVLISESIANWDMDYGLGFVFTDKPDEQLTIPLNISNESDYAVYLRYLPSEVGGQLKVLLDGVEIATISTRSNATRQLLADLGQQHLTAGRHEIVIENTSGFNALNYLMVIPSSKLDLERMRIGTLLADKQLIYLELPGLDFDYANATLTTEFGLSAINGRALVLRNNGVAWTQVEPSKAGNYTLAISSPFPQSGSITVQIANYTFPLEFHLGSRFEYTPSFHLDEKSYILSISASTRSSFDGVFLYQSRQNGVTLDQLFRVDKPNQILSYRRIDPTEFIATVNGRGPFMLTFAESYDPAWVAQINGHSVSSVLMYQGINGFPINATGPLTIRIEYSLQQAFNYGIGITVLLLIMAPLLAIWSDRRARRAGKSK